VAKFAAKAEKREANRAKSAFKQPPLIVNTQPIKSIEHSESVIKTVIKKPPIKKNNLQVISAWDQFTDEDEKLRYINEQTSCKNTSNVKPVDKAKLA
jgi:hypothetical protein